MFRMKSLPNYLTVWRLRYLGIGSNPIPHQPVAGS